MYKNFFGMTSTPFTRGITAEELFRNDDVDEINERLLHIARCQEFGVLVGDSGAGKTTAYMCIINPLAGSKQTLSNLFSTYTTTQE